MRLRGLSGAKVEFLLAAAVQNLKRLIKIGAKVVRHGRYVTFQLAEVAISRALFAAILRLIDRLRSAPLPPCRRSIQ